MTLTTMLTHMPTSAVAAGRSGAGARHRNSTLLPSRQLRREKDLQHKYDTQQRRRGSGRRAADAVVVVMSGASKVSQQGSYRAAESLPNDESDLLAQIHTSVQAALTDGKVLLDVEVPVQFFSGVVGVGSDSIAISEYNANMAEAVRVFFPDAAECSIALKGTGMNPVSGQWAQEATFHDWPGQVDYLLRDDFISQTTRKAYGLQDLPDFLSGKSDVEVTAEVSDRLYVVGYPYDNTSAGPSIHTTFEP